MLTLRVIPPRLLFGRRESDPADLLALYVEALRRRWSPADRAAAFALSCVAASLNVAALRAGAAWRNGWSAAEEALLAEGLDRRAHLSMAARKGAHRLINPGAFPLEANPLKNKRLFAERACAAGLPTPERFGAGEGALEGWLARMDAVVAKPNYASKGQGIVGLRREPDGWLVDGRRFDEAGAVGLLRRTLASGGVVQRAMPTHPDLQDLSPGALPTLRIMTAVDKAGAIEVCDRMIRLSAGGPRAVDNFNAGNVVAALDAEGRVGRAFRRERGRVAEIARHPSTGAPLQGRRVPALAEALALAARAHEAFRAGFRVIGWDVGLSAEGPVLIEGNWSPGTDVLALVSGRGLGETRLGALYRHHLASVPDRDWRAARPVQREPRASGVPQASGGGGGDSISAAAGNEA